MRHCGDMTYHVDKHVYLRLIETIAEHLKRLSYFKTGAVLIPKETLSALESDTTPVTFKAFYRALVSQGFLRVPEGATDEAPYVSRRSGGVTYYEFNCLRTVEEMRAFKDSLGMDGAQAIRVKNVMGVEFKMYKLGAPEDCVNLSYREGMLLDFLIKNQNNKFSREDIARVVDMPREKISETFSNLRKKIRRGLRFSRADVLKMLPTYEREFVVFVTDEEGLV